MKVKKKLICLSVFYHSTYICVNLDEEVITAMTDVEVTTTMVDEMEVEAVEEVSHLVVIHDGVMLMPEEAAVVVDITEVEEEDTTVVVLPTHERTNVDSMVIPNRIRV